MEHRRYQVLDAIRGCALVSMILYHAAWDLVNMFGVDWPWYRSFAAHVWQQSICWTFILLSGYCWALGRRQLRRGLTVFFCGAAITAVTWLFMRSKTGIMMKTAGSNPVLAQANGIHVDRMRILGMTLSSVLGAVGIIIYSQSYGFYQFYMAPLNMAFIAVAGILIGGATVGKATVFNVVLGTVLYQSIMTFTLPIANVIMPEGTLSEIVRIIIQNGIILYALTKAGDTR